MIIQQHMKERTEFKNLVVGDVFYNKTTDNLYLKVTETKEYNCVNLDSAYVTKMNDNTRVIHITDYIFDYNL